MHVHGNMRFTSTGAHFRKRHMHTHAQTHTNMEHRPASSTVKRLRRLLVRSAGSCGLGSCLLPLIMWGSVSSNSSLAMCLCISFVRTCTVPCMHACMCRHVLLHTICLCVQRVCRAFMSTVYLCMDIHMQAGVPGEKRRRRTLGVMMPFTLHCHWGAQTQQH